MPTLHQYENLENCTLSKRLLGILLLNYWNNIIFLLFINQCVSFQRNFHLSERHF
jgi:hypothetical protein